MASLDPFTDEVAHGSAARAHRNGHEGLSDKKVAALHQVSRRTANRWEHEGPPQLTHYAMNTPFKFPLIGHLRAAAMEEIRNETREELIDRTRALLRHEKACEGADNVNDVSQGVNWLDRAAHKEKDAGVELELAARFKRCAELRIPEHEIFGR